jgi:hypothetical protein
VSIDEQNVTNTRVDYHLKQCPPIPSLSMLRQWISVPDLLTEVVAAHVVIILAELRVWYFNTAVNSLSREMMRNLRTILCWTPARRLVRNVVNSSHHPNHLLINKADIVDTLSCSIDNLTIVLFLTCNLSYSYVKCRYTCAERSMGFSAA